MVEFPKVKYHPDGWAHTVRNEVEEKALGPGWYDNPGEFGKETLPSTKPDRRIEANQPEPEPEPEPGPAPKSDPNEDL